MDWQACKMTKVQPVTVVESIDNYASEAHSTLTSISLVRSTVRNENRQIIWKGTSMPQIEMYLQTGVSSKNSNPFPRAIWALLWSYFLVVLLCYSNSNKQRLWSAVYTHTDLSMPGAYIPLKTFVMSVPMFPLYPAIIFGFQLSIFSNADNDIW